MKPTHGTNHVMGGKLRGATDRTDYFYFFCPKCPGDQMLRILDFTPLRDEPGSEYNEQCRSKARRTFGFRLELFCEKCGLHDCVKVANYGWQSGSHSDALGKFHAGDEQAATVVRPIDPPTYLFNPSQTGKQDAIIYYHRTLSVEEIDQLRDILYELLRENSHGPTAQFYLESADFPEAIESLKKQVAQWFQQRRGGIPPDAQGVSFHL